MPHAARATSASDCLAGENHEVKATFGQLLWAGVIPSILQMETLRSWASNKP